MKFPISALALALCCACSQAPDPFQAGLPAVPATSSSPPTTYQAEITRIDGEIRTHEGRERTRPHDWMVPATLADLLMARARLTGSLDDYSLAEAQIRTSFAKAPEGSGPFLQRASLNFSLHRLDEVEADLARFEQRLRMTSVEAASVVLVRANLAAQRGQLDSAIQGAQRALTLHDSLGGRTSLAMMHRASGDWELAEAMLNTAASTYHGTAQEPLAWLALQKGIFDLDRGRYDEALAHYGEAAERMGGWWLIEEHIAEIHLLNGNLDAAKVRYTGIVGRTGKPEFMDALATIAEEQGDAPRARRWHDLAHTAFESQLRLYPEAAAGHALAHFLSDGAPEAERALALARQNASLRPNAEALNLLGRAMRGMAAYVGVSNR